MKTTTFTPPPDRDHAAVLWRKKGEGLRALAEQLDRIALVCWNQSFALESLEQGSVLEDAKREEAERPVVVTASVGPHVSSFNIGPTD